MKPQPQEKSLCVKKFGRSRLQNELFKSVLLIETRISDLVG